MQKAHHREPPALWYREPLVWMVIAIPASSVVFGIFMLVVSIQSYDGLVVDDYYKRGMEINRVLDRDRAAARHGMSAQVRLTAGIISVRLDALPDFARPESLELGLFHATRGGLDQELTLTLGADNLYRARIEPLAPGSWDLQIENGDWRLTGRLGAGRHDSLQMSPPLKRG